MVSTWLSVGYLSPRHITTFIFLGLRSVNTEYLQTSSIEQTIKNRTAVTQHFTVYQAYSTKFYIAFFTWRWSCTTSNGKSLPNLSEWLSGTERADSIRTIMFCCFFFFQVFFKLEKLSGFSSHAGPNLNDDHCRCVHNVRPQCEIGIVWWDRNILRRYTSGLQTQQNVIWYRTTVSVGVPIKV